MKSPGEVPGLSLSSGLILAEGVKGFEINFWLETHSGAIVASDKPTYQDEFLISSPRAAKACAPLALLRKLALSSLEDLLDDRKCGNAFGQPAQKAM